MHRKIDIEGIHYDIPGHGNLGLDLYLQTENGNLPVGTLGMNTNTNPPEILMIQKVKSFIKEDVPPQDDKSIIRILASYRKTEHPAKDSININWQQILIEKAEQIARQNGSKKINAVTGFKNQYSQMGYTLSLAIKQYDQIFDSIPGYEPMDSSNQPFSENEKNHLRRLMKKIRQGEIKTLEKAKEKYPEIKIPDHWEKPLL